jgi:hypothetical protein
MRQATASMIGSLLLPLSVACAGAVPSSADATESPSATSTAIPTEDAMVEYRNAAVGYSIEHPADWTVNDSDQVVTYFVSPDGFGADEFQENLNVVLQSVKDGVSLQEFGTAPLQSPQIEHFKILSSARTTAGAHDYPAWEMHYTFMIPDRGPVEGLQVSIILPVEADRTARILTFSGGPSSYEDTVPTAEAMIDSFKIG